MRTHLATASMRLIYSRGHLSERELDIADCLTRRGGAARHHQLDPVGTGFTFQPHCATYGVDAVGADADRGTVSTGRADSTPAHNQPRAGEQSRCRSIANGEN